MTRARIDVDDTLVTEVMRRYDIESAQAAVEFALRRLITRPLGVEEVNGMRGSGWEGDLGTMRSDTHPTEL